MLKLGTNGMTVLVRLANIFVTEPLVVGGALVFITVDILTFICLHDGVEFECNNSWNLFVSTF